MAVCECVCAYVFHSKIVKIFVENLKMRRGDAERVHYTLTFACSRPTTNFNMIAKCALPAPENEQFTVMLHSDLWCGTVARIKVRLN